MLLSIIIPVYNVKDYLAECLGSVLEQEPPDTELIIVDDGSSDGSGDICDRYVDEHPCVQVIHQENMGLSAARNAGMDRAQGEYLMFLDSDDMLREGCLRELILLLERQSCDIVYGIHRYLRGKKLEDPRVFSFSPGSFPMEDWLKKADGERFGDLCAQFFLYRREFLADSKLRFAEGLLHEDELWTPSVLLKAGSMFHSDLFFYIMREREGSITRSGNYGKKAESLFFICRELDRLYSREPEKVPSFLKNRLCLLFLRGVRFSADQDWDSFGRDFPLRYASDLKQRLKGMLYYLSPALYRYVAVRMRGTPE